MPCREDFKVQEHEDDYYQAGALEDMMMMLMLAAIVIVVITMAMKKMLYKTSGSIDSCRGLEVQKRLQRSCLL